MVFCHAWKIQEKDLNTSKIVLTYGRYKYNKNELKRPGSNSSEYEGRNQ